MNELSDQSFSSETQEIFMPENNDTALETLRSTYPWPNECPDVEKHPWCLDGGGRSLIDYKLKQIKAKTVLEIGSFLGGSTERWLKASRDVTVVAIDPWPSTSDVATIAKTKGCSDKIFRQLDRPEGFYQTFLRNLWESRDRVIPVRGYSHDVLHQLHKTGLRPDLIYLDATKEGDEISICHELFPDAVMSGDDWEWGIDEDYPIRKPVKQFCQQHDRHLIVDAATWLIDRNPPTIGYRWYRRKDRLATKITRYRNKLQNRRAA